jgi:uncharacterized protein YdiU (UPF0061 family)
MPLKFSNTYYQLGEKFFHIELPTPVLSPQLILWNNPLANTLAIDSAMQNDFELLAQIFSGNKILDSSKPITLAYSGHQFGQFNPYLGDGRAHLLGEVLSFNGQRLDVQLKGSGQTAYSRQGDGRCAIGPAIREYVMSEAMHAMGVPTSRCLGVVTTGEDVYRDSVKPGAVVTRVAASHIRVGTFQYFAARNDLKSLRRLTEYAIERHFSDITSTGHTQIIDFLNVVISKQIELVVQWLRVGFIHGVMNTDNTAISGETIDFGPCAMMGIYHPGTVFSSIDRKGRYAFANQSRIAQWNMARLAECMLLLLQEKKYSDEEQEAHDQKMVEQVEQIINQFTVQFEQAYQQMMAKKLGLLSKSSQSKVATENIVNQLLSIMQEQQLDYTDTFNQLTQSLTDDKMKNQLNVNLHPWYETWQSMLADAELNEQHSLLAAQQLMSKNNPVVIPRNHHIERLLNSCEHSQNVIELTKFIEVIRSPYKIIADTQAYQDLPDDGDKGYRTFCGT